MDGFLSLVPLIVVLVLLFRRVHMIPAALVGAILAMIIGGISLTTANATLMETMPKILGMVVPVINSAVAFAVFNAGGYTSALKLMNRGVGGRSELLAVSIVLLQSLATYMSGIGGGTAVVLAPLAFAACGAIPELIAGMSIAAAVAFTTSPASLESSVFSEISGVAIGDYVNQMRPYWLLFTVIAMVIAYLGAKKRGNLFTSDAPSDVTDPTEDTAQLVKTTIPAAFLLFSVLVGPKINEALDMPLFGPLVYSLGTILLIWVCTSENLNKTFESLVDGSSYILTRLFGVGYFLSFIYIIEKIGAFDTISSMAEVAPHWLMIPAGVLAGFLIGVPAGAYVGTILALILPVVMNLGFSPLAMGFVTMGVGLGSQMSFVNITMQALSSGFQIPIEKVVRGNTPYIVGCVTLLLGISLVMA